MSDIGHDIDPMAAQAAVELVGMDETGILDGLELTQHQLWAVQELVARGVDSGIRVGMERERDIAAHESGLNRYGRACLRSALPYIRNNNGNELAF